MLEHKKEARKRENLSQGPTQYTNHISKAMIKVDTSQLEPYPQLNGLDLSHSTVQEVPLGFNPSHKNVLP